MLPIVESSSIRRLVSKVSVAEYHRMGEYNANGRRTELVRGIVIEKMSKSPVRARLLRRIFRLVQAAAGPGMVVLKEDPLTLSDSEPEPDVAVVAGNEEDFDFTHPSTALLAIEVAVTSEALDREKASLYAEAGVAEYWIILAERGQIAVCSLPREGAYTRRQVYARGESVISAALPALQVELDTLFRAEL